MKPAVSSATGPRLHRLDRLGRPELGLELGRQPPLAQRRLAGQLPAAQQRAQISGESFLRR